MSTDSKRIVNLKLFFRPDFDEWLSHFSFTEGDTAALRESLAQLSSSPAESTNSASSIPSHRGGSRRDKSRRGKKTRPGSNGSRGSSPPSMYD